MADEQIIKAWEKILSAGDAPIGKHWLCGSVTTEFAKATLDMLNRQKAEIERLQRAYAVYEETTGLKRAKFEAINTYHEEVTKRCIESGIYPVIVKNIMEDVRKEMT